MSPLTPAIDPVQQGGQCPGCSYSNNHHVGGGGDAVHTGREGELLI